MKRPKEDPTDNLLKKWEVKLPEDNILQEVRSHIEETERYERWHPSLSSRLQGFAEQLTRPHIAIGYVALCVIVGLLFAQFTISEKQRSTSDPMAVRYQQLVDPQLTLVNQSSGREDSL